MDKDDTKPPWKDIIFFKTKVLDLKEISYTPFESSIPKKLLEKKEEINKYEEEHKWELAKKLANPYEMIYTQEEKFPYPNVSLIKPLSRSYFKLIEILQAIHFYEEMPKEVQMLRSAHVAEGPGGFIQAFIEMSENVRKKVKHVDAITLRSDKQFIPGWKKAYNFLKKYNDIIKINYGKDGSGDIYIKENRDFFISEIQQKVHLFTADGGFDFSVDYSQQEKQIFKLLVASFLICFEVLTMNGYCIIKLFDTYSPSTKTLISICGSMFKEYSLYKPSTSRPCNSERYFIGKKFRGINSKILNILNIIIINCNNDVYPHIEVSSEEKNYIESIEKIYEVQQIECINLAKEMAENNNLYKNYYEKFHNMCYKFCREFKIPTKN
jgi:23S rRNA U2552 (ribose-2'-O)-methylase RlmE/FtsJ